MKKLNFEEALDAINGQGVFKPKPRADVMRRKVWLAEWHIPGCISESFTVCRTKEEAIYEACLMAETENGIPRGMKTALRNHGRFDTDSPLYGVCVNTVSVTTIGELWG